MKKNNNQGIVSGAQNTHTHTQKALRFQTGRRHRHTRAPFRAKLQRKRKLVVAKGHKMCKQYSHIDKKRQAHTDRERGN